MTAAVAVSMPAVAAALCNAYFSVLFYSMIDAFWDTIKSGISNACTHMTLYGAIGLALELGWRVMTTKRIQDKKRG